MVYLGLDCGGTRTRFGFWPQDAARAGATDGVQPAAQGVEVAARALVERLRLACADAVPEAAVAAIAGAGDPAIRQRLAEAVAQAGFAFPFAVVGDTLAGAAAALGDGPGLLVFAGTGSFAVARAADGSLHRTGGRGHLLGDQGSGYDLVRRAAAAVVLAVDGLAEETSLTDALVAHFAAPSPQRLGAVLQQRSQAEVAAALPVVLHCAARGDGAAQNAIDEGMAMLAMVANAAVRQAELDWRGLPVFLGGGVLLGSEDLRELLCQRLSTFGAGAVALVDGDAAATAAARLAAAWHQRTAPMCRWVDDGSL